MNQNKIKIDLKVLYEILRDELNCLLEDSLYFRVSEKRIKKLQNEIKELEKEINGVENDTKSNNRMEQ